MTSIADGMLLRNPAWVSAEPFRGHEALCVDDREPYAANALPIGGTLVYPSQYPRTRDRLAEGGHRLREVDCSEIVKAEGAVTCCSLVFEVAT